MFDGFAMGAAAQLVLRSQCAVTNGVCGVAASDVVFVSDGSQFTTGGAENPTLTIVTLAIRQADYIAQEMGAKNI